MIVAAFSLLAATVVAERCRAAQGGGLTPMAQVASTGARLIGPGRGVRRQWPPVVSQGSQAATRTLAASAVC